VAFSDPKRDSFVPRLGAGEEGRVTGAGSVLLSWQGVCHP